jgi:hypothetical protein
MAITISGKVLWFDADIYVKISGVTITESGANEQGKLYKVDVLVNYYTNSTKEYSYKQEVKYFNDVQTTSFTIAGIYELLKTTEEFSESIDL